MGKTKLRETLIKRERERERERALYIYIYIYIMWCSNKWENVNCKMKGKKASRANDMTTNVA